MIASVASDVRSTHHQNGGRLNSIEDKTKSVRGEFYSKSQSLHGKRQLAAALQLQSWTSNLRAFTADAAGEMDVFGHNGDAFGVDGAQVGVLEQANQVSLSGLLECHDSGALEAEIGLEILGDLADETLERKLARSERLKRAKRERTFH
jgi:hypothetical protein